MLLLLFASVATSDPGTGPTYFNAAIESLSGVAFIDVEPLADLDTPSVVYIDVEPL